MTSLFAKTALAALMSLGTLTAVVPAVQAEEFSIEFGGPRHDMDGDRRHRRPDMRGCSPRQAIQEARWNGLRRAEIADVNRRRVIVEGRGRYGWGRMVFANAPGCPLISR